mmetsp:Transcript_51679/g.143074  ORF Transcript_51679/g.143074 Transcript_51679/m.143074 type:complete len:380 (-) Transcript_51679:108-1247(-)
MSRRRDRAPARARSCSGEVGHHGVVEHAAHAADGDLRRATLAARAELGLVVDAAPGVVVVAPQHADEPALSPLAAPRILNPPELRARRLVLPVSDGHDGVVDDGVSGAPVEDTAPVRVPRRGVHGDGDGAALGEGPHEGLHLVQRQRLPAVHPESRGAGAEAGHRGGGQEAREAALLVARPVLANVGDLEVLREAVAHDPIHRQLDGGPGAAATAAALLGVGHAGHELLGGEGPARGGVDLRVRLQHRGAGDGPAGAAAALRVDEFHGLQVRPVLLLRQRRPGGLDEDPAAARGRAGTAHPAPHGPELLLRAVPQVIRARGPEPVGAAVLPLRLPRPRLVEGAAHAVLLGARRVGPVVELHEVVEARHLRGGGFACARD